jgi:hypothetical protein
MLVVRARASASPGGRFLRVRVRMQRRLNRPECVRGPPQEDHLLPLMVAVGDAQGDIGHEDAFMGSISMSLFRVGDSEGG